MPKPIIRTYRLNSLDPDLRRERLESLKAEYKAHLDMSFVAVREKRTLEQQERYIERVMTQRNIDLLQLYLSRQLVSTLFTGQAAKTIKQLRMQLADSSLQAWKEAEAAKANAE